jgi:anaerobic ribonucleoside-triphosphate reductase
MKTQIFDKIFMDEDTYYLNDEKIKVIKKDGTIQNFNPEKIIIAVDKSASRMMKKLTAEQNNNLVLMVLNEIQEMNQSQIQIADMHKIMEKVLEQFDPVIAKSYKDYRNYKVDFINMMDASYRKSQSIRFIGDKDNANTDSALVATKRCLIFNDFNKRLYRKFFMTVDELQACNDGYIYVHDQSARLDTMNCLSRSTKFITDQGIKSFYDFDDGDTVCVISHKGIWRNATVHSYGEQQVHTVVFERCDEGLTIPVEVTPNHRWILQDGSVTTDLKVGDITWPTPENPFTPSEGHGLGWKVICITSESTKNKVWCLDVEEDHSFLLEYGIPTGNCCLFDAENVMKNGFEMGNIWYNEPNYLDTAFDVLGDIILSAASQQYGGFTVPEVDKLLSPYASKSYYRYYDEYIEQINDLVDDDTVEVKVPYGRIYNKADVYAMKKVTREFEQGFQGIEMKLNTVGSSRGDYPFITMTFGLATDKFGKLASSTFLKVHMNGQGKPGFKKPVLFPKLVFLYDENLHGEGKENEDIYELAIECSSKTMYPDWLSLTGEGYVPSMYKKYGRVISPMGKCILAHVKHLQTNCLLGVA